MSAVIISTKSILDAADQTSEPSRARAAVTLRSLLVAGCVSAAVGAFAAGDPEVYQNADPELARLLRAMALIKGSLVLGAIAALVWRFGWAVSSGLAAGYLISAWIVVGATMLIWQLSFIGAAAILFHCAEFLLLALAWHDSR